MSAAPCVDEVDGGRLGEALAYAVPVWIDHHLRSSPEVRRERARRCGEVISAQGDLLLEGEPTQTGPVFNRLAEGLALLAFKPGGVWGLGMHWQATPGAPWGDGEHAGRRLASWRER